MSERRGKRKAVSSPKVPSPDIDALAKALGKMTVTFRPIGGSKGSPKQAVPRAKPVARKPVARPQPKAAPKGASPPAKPKIGGKGSAFGKMKK